MTLWTVWAVVGVVMLCSAFIAGRFVTSPWAKAQENSERITFATVEVENGELALPTVTLTGTVALGTVLDVVPAPGGDSSVQVVTANRVFPGDVVPSGTALMDVSDRPLIGLSLPFPLYRDLHFGDSGADVLAVQQALGLIGLYDGSVDGVFGPATSTAITALYKRAGSVPPPPSAEATTTLEDLRAQVAARDAAPATPADPNAPPAPSTDTTLDAQLVEAQHAAGPWLAVNEIVAFTSAEMTVLDLQPVGTVLDGESPAISLRSDAARVTMRVSVAEATSFAVGGPVLISSLDGSAITTGGSITSMSDFKEGDGATGMPGYDAVVELADPAGFSDQVSVAVSPEGAAETESGLVVPLIAVREDADGNYVLVPQPAVGTAPPELRRIAVTPGLQSDGYVIVTAPDLAAGQSVVVGAAG